MQRIFLSAVILGMLIGILVSNVEASDKGKFYFGMTGGIFP